MALLYGQCNTRRVLFGLTLAPLSGPVMLSFFAWLLCGTLVHFWIIFLGL